MIIYHGSSEIVEKPEFGKGKPDNDYGSGFYTTEDIDKANQWAVSNGSEKLAITNKYEINTAGLYVLDLDTYGTFAWIAEIIANRGIRDESTRTIGEKIVEKYKIDTSRADIITGYRADDSYIDIADAFLKNEFSIDEVNRLFKEGNLGKQVFIKSQKAFDKLVFTGYNKVDIKKYVENIDEVNARKKVAKTLKNREDQIALQGFIPPGITAREAILRNYSYNPAHQYYEECEQNTDLDTWGSDDYGL